LRFTLLGWNTAFDTKTEYRLSFADVSLFEQHLVIDDCTSAELGDIGYWEWDALPNGTELRLLFASSAIFRLVFGGFRFEHESVKPNNT
jgi:hypothetical protein